RQVVRLVVLPVEQIEDLQAARDIDLPVERNPLQESQFNSMERRSDEALTRDDRARSSMRITRAAQTGDARNRQPTPIAAADDLAAKSGAVEVDAAHLEAVAHV